MIRRSNDSRYAGATEAVLPLWLGGRYIKRNRNTTGAPNTMEHRDIVDAGRNQKRHARFLQISLSRQKPCGHAQDSPVKLGVSHLLIALNQGNVVR